MAAAQTVPHRLRHNNSNRRGGLRTHGLRRGRRRNLRFGDFGQIQIKVEIIERKLEIIIIEAGEIREIRLVDG